MKMFVIIPEVILTLFFKVSDNEKDPRLHQSKYDDKNKDEEISFATSWIDFFL